jgi:hypothetical protein
VNDIYECACGCGQPTTRTEDGIQRTYVKGHNRRGQGCGWIECGYLYVSREGKKIAEHRLIVEQQEGRKLTSDEVVHHVNRDKSDNRPENLVVVTRAEHRRLHSGTKWKRWSTEEKLRAQKLKAAGMSTQDIARIMGRGMQSTITWVCNRKPRVGAKSMVNLNIKTKQNGETPQGEIT